MKNTIQYKVVARNSTTYRGVYEIEVNVEGLNADNFILDPRVFLREYLGNDVVFHVADCGDTEYQEEKIHCYHIDVYSKVALENVTNALIQYWNPEILPDNKKEWVSLNRIINIYPYSDGNKTFNYKAKLYPYHNFAGVSWKDLW